MTLPVYELCIGIHRATVTSLTVVCEARQLAVQARTCTPDRGRRPASQHRGAIQVSARYVIRCAAPNDYLFLPLNLGRFDRFSICGPLRQLTAPFCELRPSDEPHMT